MRVFLSQYTAILITYLRPLQGRVAMLLVLLICTIGIQIINPLVIRQFIDTAESGSSLSALLGIAAAFIGIAIIGQVLGILTTYVSENVGWIVTNKLREELTLHCLRLDREFHKLHSPGEMIERLDGDINELATYFSQFIFILVGNFLLLIGILLLLWSIAWSIGLTVTVTAIVALIALNYLRRISIPYWQSVRQSSAAFFSFLEEHINGAEEIRLSGAIGYVMRRLYQMMRQQLDKEYQAEKLRVLSLCSSIILFGLAYSAAFLLSNSLFKWAGLSIGTIYLIFYYLGLLGAPLWQIIDQVVNLQKAGASINRITDLKGMQSHIPDNGVGSLPEGPLHVEFDSVSFTYEGDQTVLLDGVSFQLASGHVLGLLGRTGSGKTTLVRLLLRIHDVTSGAIRLKIDGLPPIDVRQIPLGVLRDRVCIVTQEVQLFHGSLRNNLTLFDPAISDKDILDVIHQLGLTTLLKRFPEGLNTIIANGSNGLSAGEAQLLALVRVFLRDPGLVILDEASSRLDPTTEHMLQFSIGALCKNRTGIIIAHRLETVRYADEIMILEDGRIKEFGSRTSLAADPRSRFNELLRTAFEQTQFTLPNRL
ncbi:Lipid A export ATP-binding/permease protein MsbA [Thermoflexales bacterium]|nr:Lipid A export ATP-binding/permease protein MsbA [Thermoflexales bacterium]